MSLMNVLLILIAAGSNALVSFFLKKAAMSPNIFYNSNFVYAIAMGGLAIVCIVIVYQSKINMGQAVLYLTLSTLLIAVALDFFILKNTLKWMDLLLMVFLCSWIGVKVFLSSKVVS